MALSNRNSTGCQTQYSTAESRPDRGPALLGQAEIDSLLAGTKSGSGQVLNGVFINRPPKSSGWQRVRLKQTELDCLLASQERHR